MGFFSHFKKKEDGNAAGPAAYAPSKPAYREPVPSKPDPTANMRMAQNLMIPSEQLNDQALNIRAIAVLKPETGIIRGMDDGTRYQELKKLAWLSLRRRYQGWAEIDLEAAKYYMASKHMSDDDCRAAVRLLEEVLTVKATGTVGLRLIFLYTDPKNCAYSSEDTIRVMARSILLGSTDIFDYIPGIRKSISKEAYKKFETILLPQAVEELLRVNPAYAHYIKGLMYFYGVGQSKDMSAAKSEFLLATGIPEAENMLTNPLLSISQDDEEEY